MNDICEKYYNRIGGLARVPVRTNRMRLVDSSYAIEHVEHLKTGSRTIFQRVKDYTGVHWLER
jgi:hypothetical protein